MPKVKLSSKKLLLLLLQTITIFLQIRCEPDDGYKLCHPVINEFSLFNNKKGFIEISHR